MAVDAERVDEILTEEDLIVHIPTDDLSITADVSTGCGVSDAASQVATEGLPGDLVITVKGEVVRSSMVGSEDEEVAVTTEAPIEVAEEVSEILVQTEVGILSLDSEGTVAVTHVVGSRMAHSEEVRLVSTRAEALPFDSSLSHLEGQRIPHRRGADDTRALDLRQLGGVERECSGELAVLIPGLFVRHSVGRALTIGIDRIERIPAVLEELSDTTTSVELLHPLGQVLHIVGAGDEVTRLVIQPVSTVSRVACGEDGGAILDSYTDGLRAEVRSDAQLIGDGRSEEVAGRHLPADAVGYTYRAYRRVLRAVDGVAILEEVIPCDTVDRGDTTRVDGAVADSGIGGDVVDAGILAVEALREEALEATLDEASLIAVEVVPRHLVDHHRDDDAGAVVLWSGLRCHGRGERERSQGEGAKEVLMYHNVGCECSSFVG